MTLDERRVDDMPCDLAWLRENYDPDGEGDDDVRMLVRLFLGRARELLEQLRVALEADDVVALRRQLHALKGITGTVAARHMYRLVPDDPIAVAIRLPQLEQALADARVFFARELGVS
jgi:HPt (histidine-containing phosphotransfer) domain-containing protein